LLQQGSEEVSDSFVFPHVRVRPLEAITITRPAGKLLEERATIAVVGSLVGVVGFLWFDRHATVCPHCRFGSRGFEDWFSNSDGDLMFARAGLELEGWTGAIAGDTAFDVNRVGVVVGVFVRPVHHLYVAVTEKREGKRLPLGAFLYPFVALKYL
jgi:hypothetical protein